ncbi:MAG: hypothetical protein FJX77_08950 [Armatimonadetes bacterium]|nr:hypothetical protein [Armatimonadota bacterium]
MQNRWTRWAGILCGLAYLTPGASAPAAAHNPANGNAFVANVRGSFTTFKTNTFISGPLLQQGVPAGVPLIMGGGAGHYATIIGQNGDGSFNIDYTFNLMHEGVNSYTFEELAEGGVDVTLDMGGVWQKLAPASLTFVPKVGFQTVTAGGSLMPNTPPGGNINDPHIHHVVGQ